MMVGVGRVPDGVGSQRRAAPGIPPILRARPCCTGVVTECLQVALRCLSEFHSGGYLGRAEERRWKGKRRAPQLGEGRAVVLSWGIFGSLSPARLQGYF